jgi:chromatin remodeling complex protein RSC6
MKTPSQPTGQALPFAALGGTAHPCTRHRRRHDKRPEMENRYMATAKKAAATKAPAKKATAVAKAPAKSASKDAPAAKRAPNAAFMKAMKPSAALAAVIGDAPAPRTEVTKKVWEYIKKHQLQDAANKRVINADAKLKAVFKKDQVDMFEMTKLISAQLS